MFSVFVICNYKYWYTSMINLNVHYNNYMYGNLFFLILAASHFCATSPAARLSFASKSAHLNFLCSIWLHFTEPIRGVSIEPPIVTMIFIYRLSKTWTPLVYRSANS